MNEIIKFQAFIYCKCPRCGTGDVFSGSAYAFGLQKTNEKCPIRNPKFEREPGLLMLPYS